jgi:hypothetical protein
VKGVQTHGVTMTTLAEMVIHSTQHYWVYLNYWHLKNHKGFGAQAHKGTLSYPTKTYVDKVETSNGRNTVNNGTGFSSFLLKSHQALAQR